jgi:glycosyltransferase involved in cell wall biosynthesis
MQILDVPTFSIITVVLNNSYELEITIKSVINQTCQDYEYIVIDGGSTDGTLDIIKKYEEEITFWISRKDKGISDAFNKGIKCSKGQWINFLNSGDTFFSSDTLRDVGLALSENKIITGFSYLDDHRTLPKRKLTDANSLRKRAHISHQASFVDRKIFDKVGLFSVDYKLRMDYEFWLRAMKQFDIMFIEEKLVNYRSIGASNQNLKLSYFEEIRANSEHLRFSYFWNIWIYFKLIVKQILNLLK